VAALPRHGSGCGWPDRGQFSDTNLVDYEQTVLVPLPDGTDRTPLAIDATLVAPLGGGWPVDQACS
jgi:hypothetical protein